MARRNTTPTDPRTATLARIQRTERYAEQVRLLFARTVNEILALNRTMPTLDEGVMFSFDDLGEKKRREVETLLRRLRAATTLVIQKGVQVEWAQANAEADKLVASVFGRKVLESPQFTAYTQRNTKAMQAFINRSDGGLNLSDRVWKSCRQLRDEMEVAMTVAIGEGESAQDMSRRVRQYLNDPDLMFRRFRYKIGEREIKDEQGNVVRTEPVYGRKWKKRIIDPDTGRHKWIDYDRDSYRTGRGVYKSSAKNAMRVTRTETNIAYRRADHERWQQLDFVIGQRVQLSKNHPRKDICDKLQGDYPKDFKFDGWHPQCFCFVTPITVPPEETQRITEAFLKGEDWRAVRDEIMRGRQITEYPANFRDWVTEHADDIAQARERGTAPYFVTNNAKVIDGILNPGQATPAATPQAAAKPATTPTATPEPSTVAMSDEEREANQNERVLSLHDRLGKGLLPQSCNETLRSIEDDIALGDFDVAERRIALLEKAADRHAARTPKQVAAIRERWDLRQYSAEQVANFTAIENDLGVKRALSMSHDEANLQRPNPHYLQDRAYRVNCQSCVITYELRRRGFDLETLPKSTDLQRRLSYNTNLLWIDPKTGKAPTPMIAGGQVEFNRRGALKPKSKKAIAKDFEAMTAEKGRYHMTVIWKGGKDGHIVTCERLKDGTMRIYDPQTGKYHTLQYYLDEIQTARGIRLVRVDNLTLATGKFDTTAKPLTHVLKKSGTPTPRATIKPGAVSSGGGIAGATPEQKQRRAKKYKELKRSGEYKDIQYDKENGGLRAAHNEHNFDKVGGQYELQAQNAGYKGGHSVIFGKEDGTRQGVRFVEGKWDGLRFEVAGCETASSNNILHGLSHCASKPNTEIAVLVFPNGGYDESVLERTLGRFKGLKKANPSQFHQFKRVICVQGEEIIYDEAF